MKFLRTIRDGLARALDGASGGRPMRGAGRISNLNADVLGSALLLRQRSAYLARNSPHLVAATAALVTNIVGPGIKPVSQHADKAVRAKLHDLWFRFTDEADADGQTDLYGLQALMVRQMVETGESFGRLRQRWPEDGLTVPFQIQVLHPDHCPLDTIPLETASGAAVRAGIEFDRLGRRSAFYFYPQRPGDPLAPFLTAGLLNPVRVPATDVLHLMDALEPGQLRGLSWLNPAVVQATEIDAFQAAALKRAQLSNMIVGATYDAEGKAAGLPGRADGDVFASAMEPGTFLNLPPGKEVEFFDPKESQHYDAFLKSHLRAMAAGLGIPYELLTGDLSGANYSSIRSGLVEFRKRLEHWQYNCVVFRLCRPIWDRFIRMSVLAGHIPAAAYAADPAAFHRVEWLAPKQPWVDPRSDVEAEAAAVAAGFKSRRQVIAALGYDIERVDAERAMDAPAPTENKPTEGGNNV